MIDWQLVLTQVGGTTVIVAAIAWLAKSLVLQGFVRDLETHKANLREEVDMAIEQLKIHDGERTDALKRLYVFAKTLENETFPMAEDRDKGFRQAMDNLYWGRLQMDQIYFSDRADEILDRFAEMHVCMRRHELAEETEDEIGTFLEEEASNLAEELARLARAAAGPLRSSARLGARSDSR